MIAIFTIIVLLLDIFSKIIVTKYIGFGESIKVIDRLFYLTYVRNTGAAWSMFDDNRYLVLVISALIIVALIGYLFHQKPTKKLEKMAYALILGGALGNFFDRCIHGYVIDFIDFKIFNYDYPIFNLADTFIVIGVLLYVIYTWRGNDGNKSRRK